MHWILTEAQPADHDPALEWPQSTGRSPTALTHDDEDGELDAAAYLFVSNTSYYKTAQ